MHPKKFNPKYPGEHHLIRERTFTLLGIGMASAYEIVLLHCMAAGYAKCYTDFWAYPLWSIFNMAYIGYWRDGHFYFIHRLMHPWKTTAIPDVGAFLYRHVHSLHHKSYNTGPWSGLSMHPVEHLIYYTCTLLPFFISLHPTAVYMNLLHATLSPVAGHDGHRSPGGGGSFFHYLHHSRFECNYGTPLVPLDRLFGSLDDGSAKPSSPSKRK